MKPSTNRSLLLGVVGGYLIYLAYELLQGMINHTATTMPDWLTILVIVLFTLIGLGLLFFAWKVWKRGREAKPEDFVELKEGQDSATNEKENEEK